MLLKLENCGETLQTLMRIVMLSLLSITTLLVRVILQFFKFSPILLMTKSCNCSSLKFSMFGQLNLLKCATLRLFEYTFAMRTRFILILTFNFNYIYYIISWLKCTYIFRYRLVIKNILHIIR